METYNFYDFTFDELTEAVKYIRSNLNTDSIMFSWFEMYSYLTKTFQVIALRTEVPNAKLGEAVCTNRTTKTNCNCSNVF